MATIHANHVNVNMHNLHVRILVTGLLVEAAGLGDVDTDTEQSKRGGWNDSQHTICGQTTSKRQRTVDKERFELPSFEVKGLIVSSDTSLRILDTVLNCNTTNFLP